MLPVSADWLELLGAAAGVCSGCGVAVEDEVCAEGWLPAAGVACCARPLPAASASSIADAAQVIRKGNQNTGATRDKTRGRVMGRSMGAYERHFNRNPESAAVKILLLVITRAGHYKFNV